MLERLTRKPVVRRNGKRGKTRERAARSSAWRAGAMEETDMRRILVGKRRVHDHGDPEGAPGGPCGPKRRGFVALFLALLVTGLFNVWLSGQCIRTGYRVSPPWRRSAPFRRSRRFSVCSAGAESPARIHAIARNDLHMVPAQMDRVIR